MGWTRGVSQFDTRQWKIMFRRNIFRRVPGRSHPPTQWPSWAGNLRVKLTIHRHYISLNFALEEQFGILNIKLFVYSIKQYCINAHGAVKAFRHIPDIGSELHNQDLHDLLLGQ
jgi:hypothetical protein